VLGYSEADAGSDVAAVRTRATRDGDDWVVSGEKMFTTHGHVADYVFLLTRSDMEAPKRKNLTLFLVPTSAEGFSVSEVKTFGGERTNVTSYRDVRVPDAMRIGEINGGWQVLTSALRFERFSTWGPALHRLVDTAVGAAASVRDEHGRSMPESPMVRVRLARAAIDAEVSDLLALRAGWAGAIRRRWSTGRSSNCSRRRPSRKTRATSWSSSVRRGCAAATVSPAKAGWKSLSTTSATARSPRSREERARCSAVSSPNGDSGFRAVAH
jgi:alkylation response protein AidB-like acyl-CoA dehydrogenase